MKRGVLPIRTLILWQFRVVMLTLCFVTICLYFASTLAFLRYAATVITVIGVLTVVWYLPAFFKSYEMLFKNGAIIINYGVFIKFSHIMPYTRLIYAQSFATPLARLFRVTAISLKAARSRVIVPEILLSDAMRVMDSLTGEVPHEE